MFLHSPADPVNANELQLRNEIDAVLSESEPALDELRAHLDAFMGTYEAE